MNQQAKQIMPDTVTLDDGQREDVLADIIDIVTSNTERAFKIEGIVVGQLTGFEPGNIPLVDFKRNVTGRPLKARSTVALSETHVGRDVALMFEECNIRKPVIIGLMHVEECVEDSPADEQAKVISAENSILFRCGKSSLLLKKDGTIEIRGRDILARASRQNLIKGATVHIN